MGRVKYSSTLRKHVRKYNLQEKLQSILYLLGPDAQEVVDWAEEETESRLGGDATEKKRGQMIFNLISREAAIRLVQQAHSRGRFVTKGEVKLKTGLKVEMPVLYQDAGLRHPQEARNLRHNLFHEAFIALITHLFPEVSTSVPVTGQGSLSPDLMVKHQNPDWKLMVEYKGYRSVTLLSESELLKGMRYQAEYGSAWLVTTTTKSVGEVYGKKLNSEQVIEQGLVRLRRMSKRKAFTEEQRENRGIARKGIKHLEKQRGSKLTCSFVSTEELLESCRAGKPLKALAITTGLEFVEMLREAGLTSDADNVLRVMKVPAKSLHSDSVTSVRLIE